MKESCSQLLSSSPRAYSNLFESIDIFADSCKKTSFIYHSRPLSSPWAIIYLKQLEGAPRVAITLNLFNRLLDDATQMRSRVEHLQVSVSEDSYNWRPVLISLSDEFFRGLRPLEIPISSSERFLRFCNNCNDPTTELTLGPVLLETKSRRKLEALSPSSFIRFCSYFAGLSNSQLLQDLLPLYFLGLKPGFFFEAGMANGITLSNTFTLEKLFGWQGIGVEPLPDFFAKARELRGNTTMYNCALVIDDSIRSISLKTGGLLSSLSEAMPDDSHSTARLSFSQIDVPARTIMSILNECNCKQIDFLSLDLEGYELPILRSIDYETTLIKIIAVEHNHTADRDAIHDYLSLKGYIRVFEEVSMHDDFYILDQTPLADWSNSLFAIERQPCATKIIRSSLDT